MFWTIVLRSSGLCATNYMQAAEFGTPALSKYKMNSTNPVKVILRTEAKTLTGFLGSTPWLGLLKRFTVWNIGTVTPSIFRHHWLGPLFLEKSLSSSWGNGANEFGGKHAQKSSQLSIALHFLPPLSRSFSLSPSLTCECLQAWASKKEKEERVGGERERGRGEGGARGRGVGRESGHVSNCI